MTHDSDEITVVTAPDGLLLLGSEGALAEVDRRLQVPPRRLKRTALRLAAKGLSAGSRHMEDSGRWLKVSDESFALMKQLGVTDVSSGVLRVADIGGSGNAGQIVKHLTFQKAGLVTPAAPAAMASIAAQQALEAAIDEIVDYLKTIDAKVDRLLRQSKIEAVAQLGGISLAIDEAFAAYEEVGSVSEVTWSKVQSVSLALKTLQSWAVAQLDDLATDVRRRADDPDEAAKLLDGARDDLAFWLGALANTLVLQDRAYVIELARVAATDEAELERHRQGLQSARAERTRRVGAALDAIRAGLADSARLSDLKRVINPISAPRVSRYSGELDEAIHRFAESAGVDLVDAAALGERSWGTAAKALVDDTGNRLATAGTGAVDAARSLPGRLRSRREEAVLARAERILRRRSEGPAADAGD